MLAGPTAAQYTNAIGISGGAVYVQGIDEVAPMFGIFVNSNTIDEEVSLRLVGNYWRLTKTSGSAEIKARDFLVSARILYTFLLENSKLGPFMGAGLAGHFINTQISFPASDTSNIRLGVDLGGGLNFDVSERFGLGAEAWYSIVMSGDNQMAVYLSGFFWIQ